MDTDWSRSKAMERLEYDFKSTNESISNQFDVFKDSFDNMLLKIHDPMARESIKTEFKVLQKSVIKAEYISNFYKKWTINLQE